MRIRYGCLMVFVFLIPSGSMYCIVLYCSPRSQYLGEPPWYEDGIDLSNKSGIQVFSRLGVCTNYQYLIGISILMPLFDVGFRYPCVHLYSGPTLVSTRVLFGDS